MAEGGEPVIPVDEEPVNPVGGEPVNPAGEVPVNPAAEEPENPAGEEPAAQAVRPVIQLLSRELANSITVLRALLPYLDLSGVLHLSRVCPQWYDIINNDDLLWERLLREEDINNPDKWDMEDRQEWTNGFPCKSKRKFMKYKKTWFDMKNRNYSKLTFPGRNFQVHYDGRTFVIWSNNGIEIYKIDYNNLRLYQIIPIFSSRTEHFFLRNVFRDKRISTVKTNTDYIVAASSNDYRLSIYQLEDNIYTLYYTLDFVGRNLVRDDGGGREFKLGGDSMVETYFKFLFKNLLLFVSECDTLIVWNIKTEQQLFKREKYRYLKHDLRFIFMLDLKDNNVEAYNKDFQLLYSVQFKLEILKFFISKHLFHVCTLSDSSGYTISSWDKYTGFLKSKPVLTGLISYETEYVYYKKKVHITSVNTYKTRCFEVLVENVTDGYSYGCSQRLDTVYRNVIPKFQRMLIFASNYKQWDRVVRIIINDTTPEDIRHNVLENIFIEEEVNIRYLVKPYVSTDMIVFFAENSTSLYLYG